MYCLNKKYSTTRVLTSDNPIIGKNENINKYLFSQITENLKGFGGLRTKGHFKINGSFENSSNDYNNPLITIITSVFNADSTLEKSINSVINQSYDNIEYIIIDGGSKDNTIEILKKYEDCIDYWISEQDKGVYQAMNKGINLATGKWIYFLGADDELLDSNVLNDVMKTNFIDQYSLLYGDILYDNQKLITGLYSKFSLKRRNTIHHQAAIYSMKLFDNFRYNESFRISSDYELNLSLVMSEQQALKTGLVMALCGSGGLSGNVSFYGYYESIKIRNVMLKYPLIYNSETIFRFLIKKTIHLIKSKINFSLF